MRTASKALPAIASAVIEGSLASAFLRLKENLCSHVQPQQKRIAPMADPSNQFVSVIKELPRCDSENDQARGRR
ncbi:MAG: hypothetical protein WBD20_02330 [Pirellulaceae bacterium]